MLTTKHKSIDKVIEIWSIQLQGVKNVGESYYEVHVNIDHTQNDSQRTITNIFPEYGVVTDKIRKALELEIQKIDNI